jgi:hypothetical protein
MALYDRAKAATRRALTLAGETVTLRTFSGGTATNTTGIAVRILDYTPQELMTGKGLVQGDQKLIVMAEDVAVAPKKNDMAIFRGVATTIQAVDNNTRRIAGTLIAYEIQVRG